MLLLTFSEASYEQPGRIQFMRDLILRYPYPQPREGEETMDPWGQKVIRWKLDSVWALEAGGPDEPGVLWCGTIPGGLFRSGDGGSSWELVRSLWDHPKRKEWFGGGAELPGVHSVCVDPRDAKRLAVGVSCGGVWLTVTVISRGAHDRCHLTQVRHVGEPEAG